jgi:hypothetical protein
MPPQGILFELQVQHVPDFITDLRVSSSGLLYHSRRQVNPDDREAERLQVGSDVSGTAAQITYFLGGNALGEAKQKVTVEGLVIQFVGIAFSIGAGDEVIAFDEFGSVFHGSVL